jgi:hypothetical protein
MQTVALDFCPTVKEVASVPDARQKTADSLIASTRAAAYRSRPHVTVAAATTESADDQVIFVPKLRQLDQLHDAKQVADDEYSRGRLELVPP